MKATTAKKHLTIGLAALVCALWQTPSSAIPKAAEHEDAQVVIAPDVAKPKAPPKPVKKEVRKKSPSAAKKEPHKPTTSPKKNKTTTAGK